MKTLLTALAYIILLSAGFLMGFLAFYHPPTTPVRVYRDNSAETLFVRGERWYIVIGQKDEVFDMINVIGYTVCGGHTIYIHNGLNYENQRDTIFHELLHAGACGSADVWNKFYNSETETGHEGIYKISQFTTELLHTNPELARYLAGQ